MAGLFRVKCEYSDWVNVAAMKGQECRDLRDQVLTTLDKFPMPTTPEELNEACGGWWVYVGPFRSRGRNQWGDPYPLMAVLQGAEGTYYVLRHTSYRAIVGPEQQPAPRRRRYSEEWPSAKKANGA